MTDELHDLVGYLRAMITRVDSSLSEEWESLVSPAPRDAAPESGARPPEVPALLRDPRAFAARVRAECHLLVRALAARDYEEAALSVRAADESDEPWSPRRFEAELAPFYEEYERIVFEPRARAARCSPATAP